MKLISHSDSDISLQLERSEFNFIREALRELPRLLRREELPTLTGYTYEQVNELADKLGETAELIGFDL